MKVNHLSDSNMRHLVDVPAGILFSYDGRFFIKINPNTHHIDSISKDMRSQLAFSVIDSQISLFAMNPLVTIYPDAHINTR